MMELSEFSTNTQDKSGRTVLFNAVKNKNTYLVKQLLKDNADISLKDENKETAIFKLLDCYDIIVDRFFLEIIKIMKERGLDFDKVNSKNLNFFDLFLCKFQKGKVSFERSEDLYDFYNLFIHISPKINHIALDSDSFDFYNKIIKNALGNEKDKINSMLLYSGKNNNSHKKRL